ncbi:DNA mismatch repair endonuclease MutL [Candidatus Curculioniphilus buchneri]|uniref:DNA mismatch repair endonuclease MutL n=1 Tax=Candidatus Curculioniphilus buchneri TaxID=690594 RepID=UPI00376EE990
MTIQVLPLHVINQIAAGEVVASPASVIKELIENSLDAKSTHIDINVENSGSKLIRIRDNGQGIAKNELVLALSNHATSKISNLDDLDYITSMGFRGEALASINSVSRLTLTSRTVTQNIGWQIYITGHDLMITLKPVSHPVGTTVEVQDLFYNTPARRKFMRTEKTEFIYIDEIIRCIALAHFHVTFIVRHNRKIVRQYKAITQHSQYLSRLTKLCSTAFIKQAVSISWQQDDLNIRGWIAYPTNNYLSKIQYIYVNHRIVLKNKLVYHAIRQACQEKIQGIQNKPAFILFLHINPKQLDINIHPAKNEVRFHQERIVHDFIYQAVQTVLSKVNIQNLLDSEEDHVIKNRTISRSRCNYRPLEYINSGSTSRRDVGISLCHTSLFKSQKNPMEQNKIEHKNIDSYRYIILRTIQGILHPFSDKKKQYHCSCTNFQVIYKDIFLPLMKVQKLSKEVKLVQNNVFTQYKLVKYYNQLPAINQLIKLSHKNFNRNTLRQIKFVKPLSAITLRNFVHVLMLVKPCYALLEADNALNLLSLPAAERYLFERQWTTKNNVPYTHSLNIPLCMTLCEKKIQVLNQYQTFFQKMGIILCRSVHQVTLNAVPFLIPQENLKNFIQELFNYLHNKKLMTEYQIASWIAYWRQNKPISWNYSIMMQLVSKLDQLYPQWKNNPPDGLVVTLNLKAAIKALSYD